jgi:hypothetical protein
MKIAKYLIIVGLALVLIGIAYVRALFSHQEEDKATGQDIDRTSSAEILEDYVAKEEVSYLIDSLRQFYIDSLGQFYSDSLLQLRSYTLEAASGPPVVNADSLLEEIGHLGDKLNEAEQKISEFEQDQQRRFEKMVYGFYSGEITSLPSDLSDYERAVSIKEIKSKAKRYFGVSAGSLEKIVKKHKE